MAQDRLVMGVDLGTTNSCVGVWLNGRVEIVPSDQGTRTTPSCVAFTDRERLIGEGANHQVATNASNTVFDVKRLIGRSFSKTDAKYWPFQVTEDSNDNPRIKVSYLGKEKEFSPEEISAMVLVKMKETAEAYFNRSRQRQAVVPLITTAVITVPAYFNGSQRQATMDAGFIAGFNFMRIINEPTAAAIAFSVNRDCSKSTVLVYDLGGGTLDVSLLVIKKGVLQVMATSGDSHLGGEDFTNNMVDRFVNEFKSKNPHIRSDISCDKKALGRLRRSCEDAKRRLSTVPLIPVEVDALFQGIDFQSTITRDQFQELNVDLFSRCMEPVRRCLADAKMDKNKVDDVVLVGGSTRIPHVLKLVKDFFGGKELSRNINADEAVAYGATVQAAVLTFPGLNLPKVLDITPFSHGIGMPQGVMCVLFPRNTTIPTRWSNEMEFTTRKGNPSSLDIKLYEGERASLSVLSWSNAIKVLFRMDVNGMLRVRATDHESGQEGKVTIRNNVRRLRTEEIERMVKDANNYKAQDEDYRKNVQARNDIENLLYTMANTIMKLQDLVARLLLHEATPEEETQTPAYQDSAARLLPEATPEEETQTPAHQDSAARLLLEATPEEETQTPAHQDSAARLLPEATPEEETQTPAQQNSAARLLREATPEEEKQTTEQQDSAARLLPEATPEEETQTTGDHADCTPGLMQYIFRWGAQNKGKKKIQAQKDSIKKLQDSITKLQETADATIKWLQNQELTTNDMIARKNLIQSINKQIERASH
ncbi:hypothetical protein VPH35_118802 [Triticum aestivum]|uniref:Uncharacterized protein n=1 Tax=Triticum aestivum TaxID=4565 RepID=A0A3B6QJU3_WHEAT